jgi:hypothetical protein
VTSIDQHFITQQSNHLFHSIKDVNDCKREKRDESEDKMASGRMLTITDVHYVPELRVNLLSPKQDDATWMEGQDTPRVETALEQRGMANLFMPTSLHLSHHHSVVMIIFWR